MRETSSWSSAIATSCQLRIERFLADASEFSAAILATRDGFEVACSPVINVSPSKLAAMSSSLLSVADALARVGGVEHCDNIVIESESGRVVLIGVPGTDLDLVLTGFCSGDAPLGRALWAMKECSKDLGRTANSVLDR